MGHKRRITCKVCAKEDSPHEPAGPLEAYPGEAQYRGKWQFNVATNPTPTELAMIAAPLLANAEWPNNDCAQAVLDALALWKEARRVLQEQQTTTPDRAGL